MKHTYQDHITQSRRLCLLRLLSENNGKLNESVIDTALSAYGFCQSRDELRDDFRFLIDNGCATDEWVSDIMVLSITRRGHEVVQGLIEVPGIQKPSIIGRK